MDHNTTHYTSSLSPDAILEQEARQWGLFLHLSLYAGFIAPLIGFILPIVLWQIKKDLYPSVNQHGKNVVNWLLSTIIYSLVCGLLSFILVGFVGFAILFLLTVIYPIIGGIKANNGEIWKYPFSITFLQ